MSDEITINPPAQATATRFSSTVQSYRVKASVQDKAVLPLAMPEVEDRNNLFQQAGALAPPYDPEALVLLTEESSFLPQNIAAMEVNIDGYGWRLTPVIDPKSITARTRAAQDIYLRAKAEGTILTKRPSEQEIDAFLEDLTLRMEMEYAVILSFLNECAGEGDLSFTKLRRLTRKEMETTGNAYWEVLRHEATGEIQGFMLLPSVSMRICEKDKEATKVTRPYKISDTYLGYKASYRYYRRYVQEYMGRMVYFKEFGDPRTLDSHTGKWVPETDINTLTNPPAHEVIHFCVESLRTPYGVPRWMGVLYGVLGTRAAEEVNYTYFDNNTIGPLALLVSGAHVTKDVIEQIKQDITAAKKGRENIHNILIFSAESNPVPGMQSAQVRMELKPLTSAQQHDGQFMQYIKDNKDSGGAAFRQPRILTGSVDGANRAANDAALRFAEQQVYQPERNEFDEFMNRSIFLDMGFLLWKFVSNSPLASDPQTMATIIQSFTTAGILTPKESRIHAQQVLNTELENLQVEWVKQPLTLTLAQLSQSKLTPPNTTTPTNAEELRTEEPSTAPRADGSEALEGTPPVLDTTTTTPAEIL